VQGCAWHGMRTRALAACVRTVAWRCMRAWRCMAKNMAAKESMASMRWHIHPPRVATCVLAPPAPLPPSRRAGVHFKFWIADWFAQLNNKMGGDLKKIQTVGKYMVEVWKSVGMDVSKVEFLSSSEEINKRPDEYWTLVMDIARKSTLNRIVRCSQIMGRSETDDLQASQIFYPCMQCADIFFLKADICQLGMDQRKVNMLAREYCDQIKRKLKPVILSHRMMPGLLEGQEKMSKSDPNSAIFMVSCWSAVVVVVVQHQVRGWRERRPRVALMHHSCVTHAGGHGAGGQHQDQEVVLPADGARGQPVRRVHQVHHLPLVQQVLDRAVGRQGATPCNAMRRHATPCNTMQRHATPCNTTRRAATRSTPRSTR
jgi:hypothetical protein